MLNKGFTISKLCLEHCPECKLSAIQQVARKYRSGFHAKGVSILCSLMTADHQVKNSTMFFPSNTNTTRNHAICFKAKVRKLIHILDRTKSFKEFEKSVNQSNIKFGLDDDPGTEDNIGEIASQVWTEVLNKDSDTLATFEEFMNLISLLNRGFKHQTLTDSGGKHTSCM